MSEDNPLPAIPADTPPAVTPPAHSHLTVVETVYHQPTEGFPATAFGDAARFSRELESDEQPYERRKLAGEAWEPLDLGWVGRAGMLLVRNDEGHFTVNPTPEQRAEVSQRVVELSFGGECPQVLIPPGETCRLYPADASQIRLRCQKGKARYTIYLIPE